MDTKPLLTLLETIKINSSQIWIKCGLTWNDGHVCHFQHDPHFEPLVFKFLFLHLANSLHLFQDLIKDYNFAQGTHLKLCLRYKWQASKVGTLKQLQDHMTYVILQTYTILNTTTTLLLLLTYDCNPPKRFEKFKNNFLSGILSNSLWAEENLMPMLVLERTKSKFWHPTASLHPPLTSPPLAKH